jgi:hypothetical protein
MSSSAGATFSFKNFAAAVPPASADVGLATAFKKKSGDATFTFAFTDATVRDPASGKGAILTAEKPLGDGVKGLLSFDIGSRAPTAAVTVDRTFNGTEVQLKAVYKQKGDVLILEEQWKFNKDNKLTGRRVVLFRVLIFIIACQYHPPFRLPATVGF